MRSEPEKKEHALGMGCAGSEALQGRASQVKAPPGTQPICAQRSPFTSQIGSGAPMSQKPREFQEAALRARVVVGDLGQQAAPVGRTPQGEKGLWLRKESEFRVTEGDVSRRRE